MNKRSGLVCIGLLALVGACSEDDNESSAVAPLSQAPTILVDLDPASTATTVTVESITADASGRLYLGDRETGNVLRVDPAAPTPAIVGRIPSRTDNANMPLLANAGGLVFNAAGDLLICAGPFNEVVRLSASALNPQTPGSAETFITGVAGANSLVLDAARGFVYVTGGNTGNVYRAPLGGGAAQPWAQIPANTRVVPPNDFMQSVVSNGVVLAPSGEVWVADTARGAIWTIGVNADGSAGAPTIMIQDPMLEGVDGITLDTRGRLWGAVNERNALVVVNDGTVTEVFKNDNAGPLEFPANVAFVGNTGYVANFDRARRDNLDPSGTALLGIGSSIARFGL
jgi:sugar lactone lactonase YvrE